ncbi:MAG: hypothetical protein Ct9H300mP17_03070 [Candidatus Nitrosopelagicus sp.]|nr:MAG: hypothetical protein Ct9H300mP17_03070 [Candidatus Nitrosopelagicus sp.]
MLIYIAFIIFLLHAIFSSIEKRTKKSRSARAYLNSISNDRAMPALALRDNKTNVWEPVGEENLYA